MSHELDADDKVYRWPTLEYCSECDSLRTFGWIADDYETSWVCNCCGRTFSAEGFRFECVVCGHAGDALAHLMKGLDREKARRELAQGESE